MRGREQTPPRDRRAFLRARLVVMTGVFAALGPTSTTVRADTTVGPASPAPVTGDAAARFAGFYRYAGDAGEQRLRLQAINRSAEGFFIAVRGIVRDKLSDRTRIMPTFKLELGDGMIRATVPGCAVAVSPQSGAPAPYRIEDDAIVLSQRFEGSHFVQTFAADEGGARKNEFTLSPDGSILTMRATLSSPRLAVPVIYTLTYRRVG